MKKISTTAFLILIIQCSGLAAVITLQDSITVNTTLTSDTCYLIKGSLYVVAGVTLTIQPGVFIAGDKQTKGTLIIERGAKLVANGRKDLPIVFTSGDNVGSRNYGDWGGIVICGRSTVNWLSGDGKVPGIRSFYGGTDHDDNSGSLQYVRIQFAGNGADNVSSYAGLAMYGVGDSTKLEHIQVSYSGGDAYKFVGGTVNAKYLVALATWDDDFDTEAGYCGKVQFGAVIRDGGSADVSGSKAFESDSYFAGTVDGKANDSLTTKPIFSNMTVIGPMSNPVSTSYNPYYVAGLHIRRGSSMSLLNSLILGWPCGILLDESSTAYGSTTDNIGAGILQIRSNLIAGISTSSTQANKSIVYVKDGANYQTPTTAMADSTTTGNTNFIPYTGPWDMLKRAKNFNVLMNLIQQALLTNPYPSDLKSLNLVPLGTSPIIFNGGIDIYGKSVVGLKAFDPTKPLNLDTVNNYANYNAPLIVPDFGTSSRAIDAFFDKVNYSGAFTNTGNKADNWMAEWTSLDPNDYFMQEKHCFPASKLIDAREEHEAVKLYPNPATNNAVVKVALTQATDLNISIVDMTGRKIKEVFNGTNVNGANAYVIDLSNMNTGLYLVSISTGTSQKSIKLSVIK